MTQFDDEYEHALDLAGRAADRLGFDFETRRRFFDYLQVQCFPDMMDWDAGTFMLEARSFNSKNDSVNRMITHPEDYF